MPSTKKLLQAAAGNAGGDPLYAEDVFSTYLYAGNDAYQTITNGIDLLNEGGLVWAKSRTTAEREHYLWDTERGYSGTSNFTGHVLSTNSSAAEASGEHVRNIYEDGYQSWGGYHVNMAGQDYASWTFRKAEKFFDVVTYSSDTTSGARTISHNLGSTPAFILVKGLNFSDAWYVYHIGTGVNKYLELNLTGTGHASTNFWGVTDSTFTVDGFLNNNGSTGKDYVAYLFASDAGGFGDDGSESIIKCGSFSYSGSEVDINLGFEPQFFLYKASNVSNDWEIVDVMRTWDETQYCRLNANESAAEACYSNSSTNFIKPYANGVKFKTGGSGRDYIYIAIRRPMKTPESGTEVFAPIGATSTAPLWKSSFPVDAGLYRYIIGASAGTYFGSRLTGTGRLQSSSTAAEVTDGSFKWDYMNGWFNNSFNDTNYVGYNFKRATGFMDVVAYSGTGSAHTEAHNLGVAPEMMIIKPRSLSYQWSVWQKNIASTSPYYEIVLNSSDAQTDANTTNAPFSGLPTDTGFSLPSGTASASNRSGYTYIAYLFASLAGVSKVGSYTGTGSNVNVDCGFSAGARFILIKRTDSTGDWYTYDSFRGIVAGNDPYILMNTTAAQVTNTDYIDPLSSGFTVTSSAPAGLNASGGTYIFLAIA